MKMIDPIRRSIHVACTLERAFSVFTAEMTTWWPAGHFSRAAEGEFGENVKVEKIVLEPQSGGRLYEVTSEGHPASWGEVLVYDPPRHLVLAWNPSPLERPPTEVEVTFTPEAAGTRVELEHRGWERLGDVGSELRAGYASGWVQVFDMGYGAAAGRDDG